MKSLAQLERSCLNKLVFSIKTITLNKNCSVQARDMIQVLKSLQFLGLSEK
jgi:hypothetical protein